MERDEDIIEIITDEPSDGGDDTQSARKKNPVRCFFDALFSEMPKREVIITCIICAVIVISAPVIGFNVPKSDKAVLNSLSALRGRDRDYLAVVIEEKSENTERDALAQSLSEKQSELEKFHTSQDNLGKITESNASLEEQKKNLQNEIKEKQKTLDNLEASVSSYTNKIMTWSSGDYTVGKDVAAGKYVITGIGSIAIARDGKSTANKLLKSEGEEFTLSSGDKIHIDGNAKIIPQ